MEEFFHGFRGGVLCKGLQACVDGGYGGVDGFVGGFGVGGAAPCKEEVMVFTEVYGEVRNAVFIVFRGGHGGSGVYGGVAFGEAVSADEAAEADVYKAGYAGGGGGLHDEVTGFGVEGVIGASAGPAWGVVKVVAQEFSVVVFEVGEVWHGCHVLVVLICGVDGDGEGCGAQECVFSRVEGIGCLDGCGVFLLFRGGDVCDDGEEKEAEGGGAPYHAPFDELPDGACVAQPQHVCGCGEEHEGGGGAYACEQEDACMVQDGFLVLVGAEAGVQNGNAAA